MVYQENFRKSIYNFPHKINASQCQVRIWQPPNVDTAFILSTAEQNRTRRALEDLKNATEYASAAERGKAGGVSSPEPPGFFPHPRSYSYLAAAVSTSPANTGARVPLTLCEHNSARGGGTVAESHPEIQDFQDRTLFHSATRDYSVDIQINLCAHSAPPFASPGGGKGGAVISSNQTAHLSPDIHMAMCARL